MSDQVKESINNKSLYKSLKEVIIKYNLIAYSGLLLTSVLFIIFSGNKLIYNAGVVLQTATPYAIIALGGVLIYSMGNLDISVGQQVGVYVILMILITNAIGATWLSLGLSFLIILVIALLSGFFNGSVSVILKLPAIVTSLFLMFFFTGAQYLLMESTGSNSVSIDMVVKPLDRNIYNLLMIAIIIIIALIMTYVFNYTKLGKYSKAIGANEIVAAQSGINIIKWKVFAYLGFAVSIAIGSFMVLMRTGSAGNGTGTGYALDIMVCLILGGMPLSGGMKSKVSSAIIGVFIYVLLTNVLTTMGVDLKLISFVKAVIFLSIVLVTSRSKELVLPR